MENERADEPRQEIKPFGRRDVAEESIEPLLRRSPLREAHEEGVVNHHHQQHDSPEEVECHDAWDARRGLPVWERYLRLSGVLRSHRKTHAF